MNGMRSFAGDRRGATALEYCLLISGIAVAVILAIELLGINLIDTFWTLADTIGAALGG